MAQKELHKKYFFYRFRFVIGYAVLLAVLVGLLTLAIVRTPGGISPAEEQSVLQSSALTLSRPESLLTVDLPYHALQKLSIALLGFNPISMKLPSAIIAFLSSIGLVLLLRYWMRPRTSVIAGAISIASTPFIFLAQQGSPAIMTIFWPILIILLATWGSKEGRLRHIIPPFLAAAIGLSLYTPLMIYILAALCIGGIFHPHVRYIARRHIKKPVLITTIVLGLVLMSPLLYMIWKNPAVFHQLLIANGNWHINVLDNLKQFGLRFGDMLGTTIATTGQLAPYITLPTILLVFTGAYSLAKKAHSAPSYMLIAWIIFAIPGVIINPQQPEILFVPIMLLTGLGVTFLLDYWYRLFPQNPYARAFALIPLTILIGGIMTTSAARYFYLYHYNTGLAAQSSHDLQIAHSEIRHDDKKHIVAIAVSPDELPIYQLYVDTNKLQVRVSTEGNLAKISTSPTDIVLATRESDLAKSKTTPHRVIASRLAQTPSDRIYLYKNSKQ